MLRIVTLPPEPPEALDPAAVLPLLDGAVAGDASRVEQLVRMATATAELVAGRKLIYREYEEFVAGDGSKKLRLAVRPVASVVSVKFGDDGEVLVAGTQADQYRIFGDRTLYREASWQRGEPGWLVRYFGGFWCSNLGASKPATAAAIDHEGLAVQRAILEIIRFNWSADTSDPRLSGERIGGAASISTQYDTGLWCPKSAEAVLRRLGPIVP